MWTKQKTTLNRLSRKKHDIYACTETHLDEFEVISLEKYVLLQNMTLVKSPVVSKFLLHSLYMSIASFIKASVDMFNAIKFVNLF